MLERYKAGLAKARAEEGKQQDRFFVDFNDGVVREQANGIIPPRVEPHLCGLYSTETEAYDALAKYYKGKYEEALSKATKVMYFVSRSDNILMLHDCQPTSLIAGGICGYDYNGYEQTLHSDYLFTTRKEAEAELEKRKDENALEAATRRQV